MGCTQKVKFKKKRGHRVVLPAFQLDVYDNSSVIGKESFALTTIIFLFFKDEKLEGGTIQKLLVLNR